MRCGVASTGNSRLRSAPNTAAYAESAASARSSTSACQEPRSSRYGTINITMDVMKATRPVSVTRPCGTLCCPKLPGMRKTSRSTMPNSKNAANPATADRMRKAMSNGPLMLSDRRSSTPAE